MEKDKHMGTPDLMDTLNSGFTSPQKETDLANNEGDVSMTAITPETNPVKTVQPCITDNLISVPVGYDSEALKQCTHTKHPCEAARDLHQKQVGQTWKRIARNPTSSTSVSSVVPSAVGLKRMHKDTIVANDESLVEGSCKNSKRGRIVGDNHDTIFPTAEAEEQPRRVQ